MAARIPRTTSKAFNPYKLRESGPAGRYADDSIKEDLWVEQTKVSLLSRHLSLLADLSPKLKDMFFSLHRPALKRFQVRVTDVRLPGVTPNEFTDAFLEMLQVAVPRVIIPGVYPPPPREFVHVANVERVIWIAAEFKMAGLKRQCLDFIHANYKAFSTRDLVRISEKCQVDEPKILAYSCLFKPEEEVELRAVRIPVVPSPAVAVRVHKPVIRTRLCLLKSTNTAPRYTSMKRLRGCAKDMDDSKTREFLLNAVVGRPGSTLRRRELCQDNCRSLDGARRCKVCEHQHAPPKPAINYYARRKVLCGNDCMQTDPSLRCAMCDHPKPKQIKTLEKRKRKLCRGNCSHFDVYDCCIRCDHPRRVDDTRRKVLCGNKCSVFDDASGLCTTCNHPFGANSILDLDEKRWKRCRNRCSKFDFYNCCIVCEYPRQATPDLKKKLCKDACSWFVTTPDNKTICVFCRN